MLTGRGCLHITGRGEFEICLSWRCNPALQILNEVGGKSESEHLDARKLNGSGVLESWKGAKFDQNSNWFEIEAVHPAKETQY